MGRLGISTMIPAEYMPDRYAWQYAFYQWMYKLGRRVAEHIPLFLLLQTLICWMFALTGPQRLEPLILNWFWSPLIAALTLPVAKSYYEEFPAAWATKISSWIFHWRMELYILQLLLTIVVLPLVFWDWFKRLDLAFPHPFRESVGDALHLFGLHGQNGFFVIPVLILGAIALVHEWKFRRRR